MDTYYICEEQSLVDIADAIREKTGSTEQMTIAEMITTIDEYEAKDTSVELVDGSVTEFTNEEVTSISNYTFAGCSLLQSVNIPNCTIINTSAFEGCTSLQSVNFPACTSMRSWVFQNCTSLQSITLPACTNISSYAFRDCTSLQSVNLPVCTSINGWVFQNCTSLQSVSFPACTSIGSGAFSGCTSLMSLTLGCSSVAKLCTSDAFTSTPMIYSTYTGSFGSIYVPFSLVDAYKTAANWSRYSNRITSIIE